jgi:hypothetical protein
VQEYVEDEDYGGIEISSYGDEISLEQDEVDCIALDRKNLPALIEALTKIMQETK